MLFDIVTVYPSLESFRPALPVHARQKQDIPDLPDQTLLYTGEKRMPTVTEIMTGSNSLAKKPHWVTLVPKGQRKGLDFQFLLKSGVTTWGRDEEVNRAGVAWQSSTHPPLESAEVINKARGVWFAVFPNRDAQTQVNGAHRYALAVVHLDTRNRFVVRQPYRALHVRVEFFSGVAVSPEAAVNAAKLVATRQAVRPLFKTARQYFSQGTGEE